MRDWEKTTGNLINKQSICFLSSMDVDGFPNTKAMLKPCRTDGVRVFYFHTNTSSLRVGQFRVNPKACVYFCDRRFYRGVMLKGIMEVLEDAATKQMLWQDDFNTYYHEGVTDPDYCVLRFVAVSGRYYSNFKSEDFDVV